MCFFWACNIILPKSPPLGFTKKKNCIFRPNALLHPVSCWPWLPPAQTRSRQGCSLVPCLACYCHVPSQILLLTPQAGVHGSLSVWDEGTDHTHTPIPWGVSFALSMGLAGKGGLPVGHQTLPLPRSPRGISWFPTHKLCERSGPTPLAAVQ